MSQRDLLRLIMANLNRMRGRVAMTAIGVIIGTMAVILLISLAVGLQESTRSQLDSFGDLTVVTVFSEVPFGGDPNPGEERVPLDRETLDRLAAIEHVMAVTPREGLRGGAELSYARTAYYPSLVGIEAEAAEQLGWRVAEGRARLGSGQIVVGEDVFSGRGGRAVVGRDGERRGRDARSREPLDPEEVVGRTVTLELTKFDDEGNALTRRERLRVAGLLEESGGENDFSAFLALEDVEEYNRWITGERRDPREGYRQAMVKVDARENVEEVEAAIQEIGLSSFSAMSILAGVNRLFLIVQLIFGGIGAVALLVAAIGIANTMTMAIYERTKEIGIMKALGASNNDVLRIFLGEAGAIGLVGGMLGVGLGWLAGFAIDLFFRGFLAQQGAGGGDAPEHLVVTPLWLVLFGLAFATLIGLVSGVFPALRAANMKPLRALRTE